MTETAQKSGLAAFFLRLGEDRSLLAEFERDPRSLLVDQGIASDQIAAVLDGTSDEVRLALETELAIDPVWQYVLTPTRMTHPTYNPDDDDDQGDEDDKGTGKDDDDDSDGGEG
jgi:hypothetical protein